MKRTCRNAAREVCAGKTAATNRAGKIAVRSLVLSAFMGAVSAVLMAMEFPVPLAPGFVKMDFSDLPVILGGFIMGPLAGMRIIAVKIGLSFLLKGTVTMGVGELANMIGSVSYMLPAVLLYR
ncbi:ECF transporter S component, partial [Enterocloster asparagiformis]|uniref:ECF transporter S component n=1 Tax=Enterocloster asparagiformis TaxID=333367 RepID=UPI000465A931